MFRKPGKETSRDSGTFAAPESARAMRPNTEVHTRSVSYIGPSFEFSGNIVVSEALIIEGHVEGSVTCKERRLTIGKQGRVEGEVHAEEVEVRGRVEGDIYGYDRIRLHSTAVVGGTLHCRRVIIDEGAELNGGVDMKVDRKDLAKRFVQAVGKKPAGKKEGVVASI